MSGTFNIGLDGASNFTLFGSTFDWGLAPNIHYASFAPGGTTSTVNVTASGNWSSFFIQGLEIIGFNPALW